MADANGEKILNELRVIDLKQELESRGLDKAGIKSTLIDRLKEALLSEGKDPETFKFDTSAKKMETENVDVLNLDDGIDLGDFNDVEILGEDNGTSGDLPSKEEEDTLLKVKVDPKEEIKQEDSATVAKDHSDENVIQEETVSSVTKETLEAKIKQELDGSSKSTQPISDVKQDATEVKQEPTPTSDNTTSETKVKTELDPDANKENALSLLDIFPPTPTSVKPLVEFTSEDTIQMSTAHERKEDDISLIVHVDETLNEFEDLVSSESCASLVSKIAEAQKADSTIDLNESDEAKGGDKLETYEDSNADSAKDKDVKIDSETKEPQSTDNGGSPSDKEASKANEEAGEDKSKANAGSRNLWISGLASSTRATDLKTLFSKYGKVAGAKVVTNARSPMSKCYGFVTMNTADEASNCIRHLHHTELHGRIISVERAKADPSQGKVSPAGKKESDSKARDKRSALRSRESDRHHRSSHVDRRRYPDRAHRHHDTAHRSRSRDRRRRSSHRSDSDKKKKSENESKKDKKSEEVKKDLKKDTEGKESITDTKVEDNEPASETKKSEKDASIEKTDGEKKEGEKTERKDSERQSSDRKKRSRSRGKDGKEMLSLEKIKEERERERQRLRERRARQDERRRREEMESDRIRLAQRQRHEAVQLQRERDRLRIERERLEREKLEAERERILFEREKRERERAELAEQRRLEAIRFEERQRALKRPYDRPGDDYWGEPKRAAYDSPPSRLNDFDREGRLPPRGSAYGRDAGYSDRGGPRDRVYDRSSVRDPPRFEDRREDRDRRERDRDDRVPGSDRYNGSRYDTDRRGGARDPPSTSSRDHASSRTSDRHDTRRVSPHRQARDPSPRSRDKQPRDSHRESRTAAERTYNHSSTGSSRDNWAAPPARRSHDKDAPSYARTSAASVPTSINSASLGVDKHSGGWQDASRVMVPAAAARPGSQWVTTSTPVPGRTLLQQPVLQQHPAAGHPQFLISAANIISAGLGGIPGAKPDTVRYSAAYNPPRRY